jgi:hypothetical protein
MTNLTRILDNKKASIESLRVKFDAQVDEAIVSIVKKGKG